MIRQQTQTPITALYCRLSRNDELQSDMPASIVQVAKSWDSLKERKGAAGSAHFKKPDEDIHGFCKEILRRFFRKEGIPAPQIQHPRLVAKYYAVRFRALIQAHMEGVSAVGMGNGAYHGQIAHAIIEVVADDERRAAAALLLSRLGVKVQIDDVPL